VLEHLFLCNAQPTTQNINALSSTFIRITSWHFKLIIKTRHVIYDHLHDRLLVHNPHAWCPAPANNACLQCEYGLFIPVGTHTFCCSLAWALNIAQPILLTPHPSIDLAWALRVCRSTQRFPYVLSVNTYTAAPQCWLRTHS
jgi:hypothetical protein